MKKEKLKQKILSVFKEYETLSWHQVYLRLKLPISRLNWDYIDAWEDIKVSGILTPCINNTYRKII